MALSTLRVFKSSHARADCRQPSAQTGAPWHRVAGVPRVTGVGIWLRDQPDSVQPNFVKQTFFVVDAFTKVPFAGNPAAVCVLDTAAPEPWMRAVAREMNLSETAFVHKEAGGFRLRWLTPEVEVDLCGHATLATAHVLWQTGVAPASRPLQFHSRSGSLGAQQGQGGLIELDFPAKPIEAVASPANLAQSLGAEPLWVGKNAFDYLVELSDETTVRGLRPDFGAIAALPVRGIMVTARALPGSGHDFVSRFFGPAVGIPEDPVTGAAHCALGPYWGNKLGKTALVGFQASQRGGTVQVVLRGERVTLAGHAVTVSRGETLGPDEAEALAHP